MAVILDAAQGRLSRRSIKAALELDYMVLIIGSKFYGGPTFSGALLVPPYTPRRRPGSKACLQGTLGFSHGCGIKLSGHVDCWRTIGCGGTPIPPAQFKQIDAGRNFT